ncbi:DUF2975 domain-containing protein [Pannonibacter sp. SL95]|uniref:DUF2975 domain-containing protein n=1 Tax=Pannonibacter sp. SL95 TaxID=2995153 RepID=UPI0022764926|nr:DUF2975 domain-containing protein [Pannonibacter sp. SL95]MCY1708544.1 DUF2975 domain-containing protein [Pannonibacter sp. SL95]
MISAHSAASPETNDERTRRLKRISTMAVWLKWLLTGMAAICVACGLLVIFVLILPSFVQLEAEDTIDIGEVSRGLMTIGLGQRMLIALFLTACIWAVVMLLWKLRQIFAQFGRLDFFSSRTLSFIVETGWWLLALGLLDFVADPIGTFILTYDLPEGQRTITFAVEAGQILFLVFGPLTLLFGWVMREAALAYEENQQFV